MKLLNTRTHFTIALILTLVLLIGSTILQQIVFKADQELASLVISPTSFRATSGELVDFDVTSRSSDTVFATGLEADITFDALRLSFIEAVPVTGWRTVVLEPVDGRIRWLVSPLAAETAIIALEDDAPLGRLRFRALAPGVASVTLDQASTILSAADPVSGNFIYNAASSVQSSSGTVASTVEGEQTFPETDLTTLTAPETTTKPLFGSQRIVGTFAAAASSDALVFVTLGYPGRASVEFGVTPKLGNTVESLSESTHHVLRLAGLEKEQRYYYRIIGERSDEQSEVVGQIRSFTLPPVSTNDIVSAVNSEVIVFPNRAERETTLYVFPRDEAGGAVSAQQVELEQAEGVTVSQPKRQADYAEFDLVRSSDVKTAVTLQPKAADVRLAQARAVLDPSYTEPNRLIAAKELVLSWNNKAAAVLFGGVILLFVFGLFFVRLARGR